MPSLFTLALTLLVATSTARAHSESDATPSLHEARVAIRAGDIDRALHALYRLEVETTKEDERHVVRFLLGKLHTERGSPLGHAYLSRIPKTEALIADRVAVWLARAHHVKGPSEASASALEGALTVAEDEEQSTIRLMQANTLEALGRHAEADALLKKIAADRGPRTRRAQALLRLLKRTKSSDRATVKRLSTRLLIDYSDLPEGQSPALVVTVPDLSDKQRMQRAKNLMRQFIYDEPRREFRRLLSKKGFEKEARWQLGVIGLNKLRDDPEGARAMFRAIIRTDKKRAEEAMYSLMRTYIKTDDYAQAQQVAARYQKRYPNGDFRERVAYYSAWMPYDERDDARAIPALRRYIAKHGYKKSYMRGFLAWSYLRMGNYKGAIEAFDALINYGGPLTTGKAWYWQAYALDKLGRRGEAREKLSKLRRRFPITYYDVLGQQMLAVWQGRDPRASALPWPEGGGLDTESMRTDKVWSWPRAKGRLREAYREVQLLTRMDEVDLARRRYRQIRDRVEQAVPKELLNAFILNMTFEVEDFKHGWDTATGRRLSGLSSMPTKADLRWALGYPRAYGGLVSRLGERYDIPDDFIWGIMRQESRYSPAMISAKDAIGALQMIPQTALLCAKEMGTVYDQSTFADPRVGFPFSAHYMARHNRIWRGQLLLTAASYNAGPTPVARWLKENPDTSMAVFIEEFSYNEARVYTRQVASHTLRNLWLYEPDPTRRGPILDAMFPVALNYDVQTKSGY